MVLLDTHTFVWLASDQRKLSKSARALLERPDQSAAVSLVTSWEIALLSKRDRLQLPVPAEAFVERALRHHNLAELAIDRNLVFQAVRLPDLHNDPFDRLLIATARHYGIPLISKDKVIAGYPGVEVVW